jgi:hypothetical protein
MVCSSSPSNLLVLRSSASWYACAGAISPTPALHVSASLFLSSSCSQCAPDRGLVAHCCFQVMFSIVNLTFVVMGLIMFGNILEEFSTLSRSFQTLVRA